MKKISLMLFSIFGAFNLWAGEIKITTNLKGFSDSTQVYFVSSEGPLANTILQNGIVEITAEIDSKPDTYYLYLLENNQPYIITLFVADENITIQGSKEDLIYNAKISGSTYHSQKEILDKSQMSTRLKGDALQKEMQQLQATTEWQNKDVQEKYIDVNGSLTKIDNELKDLERKYILENFDLNYAQSLLEFNLCGAESDFYTSVYNKMSKEDQKNDLGKKFLLASKSKKLSKGDTFLDIEIQNKDLETIKLSNYFKNDKKYILVDLSSVTCLNSNQAFPITKTFSDNNTENLQIVSVLQSPDAETYKHFGKLNTSNWEFVYAENFLNSDDYIKYQENATPTFLLFDNQGKLIDRWVGASSHELKMNEYFGTK
nr:DUF4369 domain-containing protein [uncultured Flavobacterium sp.]